MNWNNSFEKVSGENWLGGKGSFNLKSVPGKICWWIKNRLTHKFEQNKKELA
jgi:hypothetical protein